MNTKTHNIQPEQKNDLIKSLAVSDCNNGVPPRFKNNKYLSAYGKQYEYNEKIDYLTSTKEL